MEIWIARDFDGALYIYAEKPYRRNVDFIPKDGNIKYDYIWLRDNSLFPEITWENSPKKIKLELIEDDQKQETKAKD